MQQPLTLTRCRSAARSIYVLLPAAVTLTVSRLRRQEAECFAAAAALDTHKALVHIFFAQRSTKKVRLGPIGHVEAA